VTTVLIICRLGAVLCAILSLLDTMDAHARLTKAGNVDGALYARRASLWTLTAIVGLLAL